MNECTPDTEQEEKEMLARERARDAKVKDTRLRDYLRTIKSSMGAGTLVKPR